MNRKKISFLLCSILLFIFLGGCNPFPGGQKIGQNSISEKTGVKIQIFDLNSHFTIKATPDKNSEACVDADALTLTFQGGEYGEFEIKLPDIIYDYCDGTVHIENIVGEAYQLGDIVYFPLGIARDGSVLDIVTYKYHLKEHQLEEMDKSCLMLDDSQLMENGIIKGTFRRVDHSSILGKQERNEEVYCDLKQYIRYNVANYSLVQNKPSSPGVQAIEEQDKEFIHNYYRLLENHWFDEVFGLSLRKGKAKDKNPFYEWYKELQKAEVVSIVPQGDRIYEVKTKITSPIYEITIHGPGKVGEEVMEYQALKKVVEKDGNRYLDNLTSKDITPQWNCKKKILKQRIKKCSYESFFKETDLLESSASSKLANIGIVPLDGYLMFNHDTQKAFTWDMIVKFGQDKTLRRKNCNDGIGCATSEFFINGGSAFAYELDPKRFYGNKEGKLYNLVYSRYTDELSEIGFDEEYDQKILSKYCAKNPELKLTLYECEQE